MINFSQEKNHYQLLSSQRPTGQVDSNNGKIGSKIFDENRGWKSQLATRMVSEPRFYPIEAAPIQSDKSDGEEINDGDVASGKNLAYKFD